MPNLTLMTYNEFYGDLPKAILSLYKKLNVSPADHDDLYRVFGENWTAIYQTVNDPNYWSGASFSFYKFAQARL